MKLHDLVANARYIMETDTNQPKGKGPLPGGKYGAIPSGKFIDGVPEADLLAVSDHWRKFMTAVEKQWFPQIEALTQHVSALQKSKNWQRQHAYMAGVRSNTAQAAEKVPQNDQEKAIKAAKAAGKEAEDVRSIADRLYKEYAAGRDVFNQVMKTWELTAVVSAAKKKPPYVKHDLSDKSAVELTKLIIWLSDKLVEDTEAALDKGLKVARLFRQMARTGETTSAMKKLTAVQGGEFEKGISQAFYRGPLAILRRAKEWIARYDSYVRYEDYEDDLTAAQIRSVRAVEENMRAIEETLGSMLDVFEQDLLELETIYSR